MSTPTPDLDPQPESRPLAQPPIYAQPWFYLPAAAVVVVLVVLIIIATAGSDDNDPKTTPTPTVTVSASPSSSPSPSPSPSTTTSPSPSASASPESLAPFAAVTAKDVTSSAFVDKFRKAFPKLAEERSDKRITDTGVRACNVLVRENVTPAGVIADTAADVSESGEQLDESTVKDVLLLAVRQACPSRSTSYSHLFG